MISIIEQTVKFIQSELKTNGIKISKIKSGREGVDFLVGNYELYLQAIDLETQRSIKIPKQAFGVLTDTLFVALVLVMTKEPQGIYLILSKQLSKLDHYIFFDNEVSSFPSLSNWEIKVFVNAFPEFNKFSLSNMIDKQIFSLMTVCGIYNQIC